MTNLLAGLGIDAFGIDLSPEMVAVARRAHPELRFEVGSMLDLRLANASLGSLFAYYSIIHIYNHVDTAYEVRSAGAHGSEVKEAQLHV